MKREILSPRKNWQEKLEDIGFNYHSIGGTYWQENACYSFTAEEIDTIEAATQELHEMCLTAIDYIICEDLFEQFAIPVQFKQSIIDSWHQHQPSIYGRFDLSYQTGQPPKLLEYNADTPTALLEASVAQWYWLQDVKPDYDQFNSIHEKLIDQWKYIKDYSEQDLTFYFSSVSSEEDFYNLEYLRDTAIQAEITTQQLFIEDIGWNNQTQQFIDLNQQPINALFKLYPWEWMINEEFGQYLLNNSIALIIEPYWKMLLSNKTILPILWQLYPDHPNLLPAYFKPDLLGDTYVKKPILSREGANISIKTPSMTLNEQGTYGAEGYIYQAYAPLPKFNDNYAVIGSWIIGNEAAGIGVREDNSLITKNSSRFVPHYFIPEDYS